MISYTIDDVMMSYTMETRQIVGIVSVSPITMIDQRSKKFVKS